MNRSTIKLQTFMRVCENVSLLSHDPTYQVGSIVVSDDFREICSIGYNGDYRGGPNERVNMTRGESGFLHAEENALFHLARPFDLRDRLILMCTHKPCTMCAKRIVNSGVSRVVYKTEYTDTLNQTDEVFRDAGVRCVSLRDLVESTWTKDYLTRRGSSHAI